jgi:hypothetical protein
VGGLALFRQKGQGIAGADAGMEEQGQLQAEIGNLFIRKYVVHQILPFTM